MTSFFLPARLRWQLESAGLKGSNWEISFKEKCFCDFILTHVLEDGTEKTSFEWSSDSARDHKFGFMHHAVPGRGEEMNHRITRSSSQESEGSGLTISFSLPYRNHNSKIMSGSGHLEAEKAQILCGLSSLKHNAGFRLEIVFAKEPEAFEKEYLKSK